jgi:Flp pilus assembly protein TadD
MSTVTSMLERISTYDAYRWALDLFEHKDYYRAAEILRHVVDADPDAAGLGEVRELLARSYYHSAQLGRAAEAARDALAHDPTNAYAALLLARSLERATRLEEADAARRLAVALGAPA